MKSPYQKAMLQKSNQAIGIKTQEIVAIELEKYYPPPHFKIYSNGSRFEDIIIFYQDIELLKAEVKSAIELYMHNFWAGKKQRHQKRRGAFNIEPHQLKVDFWAFLVRFTDKNLKWNENYEIWWCKNEDLSDYLYKQPLHCKNWKLCIDKLQIINASLDFNEINPLLQ